MSIHNYSELCPGLYENLVDEVLEAQIAEQKLDEVAVFGKLDENELPKAFSQYFSTRLEYLLSTVSKKEWPSIIASVLSSVSHVSSSDAHKEVSLKISAKNQLEYLAEIKERPDSAKTRRPATNLSNANLITNAPNDPSLEQELTSEFDSADQVDAVIAFIRASSMHTLYQQFQKLRDRGIPVRIITSTYTGSTERRVLDKLVREYGVQVKVSYNSERTRLHAKSWLIHRKTGFSTAYIGSSNLSKAAMQSGAEWNVRLTEANVPEVFSKFRSMFDSYWNSPEYELYEPDKDAEKFDEAIRRAKGYNTATALNDRSFIEEFSLLEVTPFEQPKNHAE